MHSYHHTCLLQIASYVESACTICRYCAIPLLCLFCLPLPYYLPATGGSTMPPGLPCNSLLPACTILTLPLLTWITTCTSCLPYLNIPGRCVAAVLACYTCHSIPPAATCIYYLYHNYVLSAILPVWFLCGRRWGLLHLLPAVGGGCSPSPILTGLFCPACPASACLFCCCLPLEGEPHGCPLRQREERKCVRETLCLSEAMRLCNSNEEK